MSSTPHRQQTGLAWCLFDVLLEEVLKVEFVAVVAPGGLDCGLGVAEVVVRNAAGKRPKKIKITSAFNLSSTPPR